MRSFLILIPTMLLFAACGGKDKKSATPANPVTENPCGENPCGGAAAGGSAFELPVDLSGWQTWTQANKESWLSQSHNKAIVDVFVTADHADAYKSLAGPLPVGAALVKAQYKNADGAKGDPQNLTVMVKMSEGFDPDGGDWYYGVYSFDGKSVIMEGKSDGKTAMCAGCHDTADVDHVFGSK